MKKEKKNRKNSIQLEHSRFKFHFSIKTPKMDNEHTSTQIISHRNISHIFENIGSRYTTFGMCIFYVDWMRSIHLDFISMHHPRKLMQSKLQKLNPIQSSKAQAVPNWRWCEWFDVYNCTIIMYCVIHNVMEIDAKNSNKQFNLYASVRAWICVLFDCGWKEAFKDPHKWISFLFVLGFACLFVCLFAFVSVMWMWFFYCLRSHIWRIVNFCKQNCAGICQGCDDGKVYWCSF